MCAFVIWKELNLTLIQRGQRAGRFYPEEGADSRTGASVLAAADGLAAEAAICRRQMVGQLQVGMVPGEPQPDAAD